MKQTPDEKNTGNDNNDIRNFRLVLLRRIFAYVGAGLVISAAIGGLYQDRIHFIWSLCAAGAILLAMAWWEHLDATDSLPFFKNKRDKKPRTPYILRKEKDKKRHKPAFMQNAEDFDDDLTPYTTPDMESLEGRQRSKAIIIARVVGAVILFILSFVIKQ